MQESEGRHIVVVGPMGVGKTTIGALLATELGRPFHDSDAVLEDRTGEEGATIAEVGGVERLHQLELEVFLEMCRHVEPSVIAPAASVVDHDAGRRALADNYTVWLTASHDVVVVRQGRGDHRRSIDPTERAALHDRRGPWLESVSATTIDTTNLTPPEIVEAVIARLSSANPGL